MDLAEDYGLRTQAGECGEGITPATRLRARLWIPIVWCMSSTLELDMRPNLEEKVTAGPWQPTRPRSFPDANKTEKKVLKNLGFPLPTTADVREARAEHCKREAAIKTGTMPQNSSGPRRSQRRAMWKTVAFLSVMFNAVLSTMHGAACEAVLSGIST